MGWPILLSINPMEQQMPTLSLFDQAIRRVAAQVPTPRIGRMLGGDTRLASNDECSEAGDLTLADLQRIDDAFGITPRHLVADDAALREKLRDEYATGLDKTGPQWGDDEEEQA